MSKKPLVSIIVPTKNSAEVLGACLQSVKNQTYQDIELIVVDNYSSDGTPDIAKEFTTHVFSKGPERSAQRNFGVSKSAGSYVVIIDSDMELSATVIEECVEVVTNDKSAKAVIIPEESFGEGFWAQCKKLERSFYVGVPWIEAARFFSRDVYIKAGGYDESMISGEDWDLSQRAGKFTTIGRVDALIYHNEGRLKLFTTLKKKFYYAQAFSKYKGKSEHENIDNQTSVFMRYKLFFSDPKKLFRRPFVGLGMLIMKTLEFAVGALGLMKARFKNVSAA